MSWYRCSTKQQLKQLPVQTNYESRYAKDVAGFAFKNSNSGVSVNGKLSWNFALEVNWMLIIRLLMIQSQLIWIGRTACF